MLKDSRKDSVTDSRYFDGTSGEASSDIRRFEVIAGVERRHRWSEKKMVRIVTESFQPGQGVSVVARQYGVSPSLVYVWRRQFRAVPDQVSQTPQMAPTSVPMMVGSDQAPVPGAGGTIASDVRSPHCNGVTNRRG